MRLKTALAVAFLALCLPAYAAGPNKGGLAAVEKDGTLLFGTNVRKASLEFTGFYWVKFKRSVAGCNKQVTPANFSPSQQITPITITVAVIDEPTNKKTVGVFTYSNFDGDAENIGFYLKVTC